MRPLIGLLATCALAGCGDQSHLILQAVTAARGADDRVTVTATVFCHKLSGAKCKDQPLALSASWRSSNIAVDGGSTADGGVIDSVEVTPSWSSATAEKESSSLLDKSDDVTGTFTIVSDQVIPKQTGISIRVEAAFSKSDLGTGNNFRDPKQDIASP